MIKKSALVLGLTAAFYLQAQDVSVIKNTTEVYSNPSELGTAKYNAMAGAMGALGGDISSINSNPAGLGVFITGDMGATLNIHNTTNTSTLAGKSINYKINNTDLGQIGGVMAFENSGRSPWKFINIGVNYTNKSLEDYVETPGNANIKFVSLADPTVSAQYAGHAYNRYGNQSKMNLALAGNYDHKFYVGGSLNFHSAVIEQYDSARFTSGNSADTFNKQFTPFSENSNGFSASLGVIGKVNNQFRIGASLETPTWWTINRVYTGYDYNSAGNLSKGTYDESRKLTSPLKATISGAFVPNKNFAVNVDYTFGFSKPTYKVAGGAETELNDFFNKNSSNLSELKIGAEYRIDAFRLRGGYGFQNSPFSSMTINTYNDSGVKGNANYSDLMLGKRNTIGAGLGYNFKSFYIDVAYQNVSSEYNNPFLKGNTIQDSQGAYYTGYFNNSTDVTTEGVSAVSKVSKKMNNVYITAGWKF